MIGVYEPYVEVCKRLAELSPCRGEEQRSILVNSGAEAVENAVKIARWATGRSAVIAFDNAFHGRTLLAMTMTSKVKPYKAGFGPFAPEIYRAPSPYPYHGISSDDSIAALEHLFKADVDPSTVACVVLEPVQGEGGFLALPPDYPAKLQELCRRYGILWVYDEVQSGVGRTGTMWAIEQYAGAEPDMTVFGKSIGGGLPLAGVTGGAEVMDAVPAGGLGGTFGGNPLSCAAALAVLDIVTEAGSSPAHVSWERRSARVSTTSQRGTRRSARYAVSARCWHSSSRSGRPTARRPSWTRRSSAASAPLLWPLRQRHPPAAPSQHRAGRVGRGARRPGGVACRLMRLPDISVRGLTKRYGDVVAVDGIDLDIPAGEFFTMLGPSGSGKTTTLRMIAGFEMPDEGSIELAGEDVSRLPPYDRPVNTVFQDYALFPHMTVQANVEYGLMVKKVKKGERRERATTALEMVRLAGYGDRKPSQLSGGQRQRVALARAIVKARRCSSSTSRSARSISSCARRCRSSSSRSSARSASPSST